MSDAPSQQALPRQIDPRKFAQQGVSLSGQVEVAVLSRLIDATGNSDGVANVDLVFGFDQQRAKCLNGRIDCQVSLVCQRCLELSQVNLHCDLNLVMVWDDVEAAHLSKDVDAWIVGEGVADLYEVLEEELLLALPLVAYHEYDCLDPSLFSSGDPVDEVESSQANPFKVLKQLKNSSGSNDKNSTKKK